MNYISREQLWHPMSPIDFQRFHADLTAAVTAEAPINFRELGGDRMNSKATLADLNRWRDERTARLNRGTSESSVLIDDWDADSKSCAPRRYRAALKTFAATGTMLPVLEGLTVAALAQRQVARVLRWPFIYLFIVLAIAWVGTGLFVYRISPLISELRADLLLPAAIKTTPRFNINPWLPTVLVLLAIGFLVFLLAMLLGGFKKLIMSFGGRRYVKTRASMTGIKILRSLVVSGMPIDEAISVCRELTGPEFLTAESLSSVATCTDSNPHWLALANYRRLAADQQLSYLKFALPMALVTIIGGVVGLLYGLAIYGPIVALIRDLTTAGT